MVHQYAQHDDATIVSTTLHVRFVVLHFYAAHSPLYRCLTHFFHNLSTSLTLLNVCFFLCVSMPTFSDVNRQRSPICAAFPRNGVPSLACGDAADQSQVRATSEDERRLAGDAVVSFPPQAEGIPNQVMETLLKSTRENVQTTLMRESGRPYPTFFCSSCCIQS